MSAHKKPSWGRLKIIGLFGAVALLIEPRLSVAALTHTWLLLVWVGLFYGALALWVRQNSEALEREPRPRDCVGRPIIDEDLPECEAKARPKPENPAVQLPVVRPLGRSEVI
jgi:hypothetical protein